MAYWLMKTEPSAYSIDDLKHDGVTPWDGIRNYQARNLMRDQMQLGDLVFVYHSVVRPPAIVGVGKIVSKAYPDASQFDTESKYFDAKSNPDQPRWLHVDVAYEYHLARPVSLPEIRADAALASMDLVKKGNRLSIQPVSEDAWQHILDLAQN